MKKQYKPIGKKIVVTSRGVKEECGLLIVPSTFLRDSNVCTTNDGETVIIRDKCGFELEEHVKIVKEEDVLAVIKDGVVTPAGDMVLVRKCLDREDELIVTSLNKNSSEFAEILAAGDNTVVKRYIGWLANVDATQDMLQKVEETEADWLVCEKAIRMIVKTED
jgi:hypothetical protein